MPRTVEWGPAASDGSGNRLLSHATWNFTCDDEGNLTKKSKGATHETWTYQYDQRNQLTSVKRSQTDGGAIDLQTDFKYDASGNRVQKSYDADGAGAGAAAVTRFALDMWKNVSQHLVGNENVDVWADHTSGGSLTTRYLRGDIVDQLFARQDAGTQYWYLTDHLGSIRDVITNSAVVKDSIQYNVFGEIISETDPNYRGRYAWTGREFDVESTLQYNRARYYDAYTARWTSQDPLGFDAGDSNLYRYARNSPTIDMDPSGLSSNKAGNGINSPAKVVEDLAKNHKATSCYWRIVFTDAPPAQPLNALEAVEGHAWIGVADTKEKTLVCRGFYPDGSPSLQSPVTKGKFQDDTQRKFLVARAYPISKQEYEGLAAKLSKLTGAGPNYHMGNNNCTSMTINLGGLHGVPKWDANVGELVNTRIDVPRNLSYFLTLDGSKGSVLYDSKKKDAK